MKQIILKNNKEVEVAYPSSSVSRPESLILLKQQSSRPPFIYIGLEPKGYSFLHRSLKILKLPEQNDSHQSIVVDVL